MNDSSYIPVDGGVCAPQGFLGSAVSCGIKKPTATRLDLALIYSTEPCVSAGTFTTNRVQAACVKVSREHLRKGNIRAIVANSGNANACTGTRGVEDARGECRSVAELLGLEPAEVAVCSTGVIGLPMPMMRIYPKFPELAEGLSRDKGHEVAQAVMTSDTKEKIIAIEFVVQGKPVRIGACCKGAGMINPCMATMLCFITTDAGVSRDVLELCVQSGVKSSFNCITIDGDMSTNDTVLVMANGASGVKLETPEDIYAFQQALAHVMLELAKHIVQDGERVTKFVTVHVTGGRTEDEAKKAAEAVAKSSLVKSSWNGNDPNWGRIIHAVGYCGAKVDEEKIDIDIAGLAGLPRRRAGGYSVRRFAASRAGSRVPGGYQFESGRVFPYGVYHGFVSGICGFQPFRVCILEPGESGRPDLLTVSVMARGKCRQGKAGGMAPAAGMLMEVRRLLDEGAFRASRAQRFCTGAADCCRFRLTGETPHVTLGEAWVAWKAWRASGRTRLELPPDGSCPFLSGQGRCMIYEGRPLACRTHFCVPAGGALPRREVIDLIHALEDIDAALGGDGAAGCPEAVERLSRKGPADGRKRRR